MVIVGIKLINFVLIIERKTNIKARCYQAFWEKKYIYMVCIIISWNLIEKKIIFYTKIETLGVEYKEIIIPAVGNNKVAINLELLVPKYQEVK